MRIALDAMGGDHAPSVTVAGAKLAADEGLLCPGQILLVGKGDQLGSELDKLGLPHKICVLKGDEVELPPERGECFPVLLASQVIGMHENPVAALRQQKDSSLAVATRLVKLGHASAIVSAGNTGACVAFAIRHLKSLEGIRRPGIAVTIEGEDGPFTVIDVGANISPKAKHLLHYGVMGATLQRETCGKNTPRVGLLNIGGEEGKGNVLAKEVQELFRSSGLNYIGNIEGQDVFNGVCDVIVTEGFVGNVLLKLSEGLAIHILHVVNEELVRAGVQPEVINKSLAAITRRSEYSEYGGALLLGVEGIVTICHGRSEERAIKNALKLSRDAVRCKVNSKIVEEIGKLQG